MAERLNVVRTLAGSKQLSNDKGCKHEHYSQLVIFFSFKMLLYEAVISWQ